MISEFRRFVNHTKKSGLKNSLHRTKSYLICQIKLRINCDIGMKLPRSTVTPHPTGIVVTRKAEIGRRARIYQNVTIGVKNTGSKDGPKIGDDVTIYAGAAIIGNVTIGDGAVIGANSVVIDDVPKETVVGGVPAEEIKSSDS